MFRNQVDTTVQFSKMIIQFMHYFVFKDYFFLQFSNLKPWLVKSIMVLFSVFSDEFNFFSRQVFFFFYQHTQCLGCAFIRQKALQLLFSILSVREDQKIYSHFQILLGKIACAFEPPALTYNLFSP